jgi:hypothetical protein
MSMMRRALLIGILGLSLAACGDDDGGEADAVPTPDADTRGTITFDWTITDGTNPLTCDDVGGSAITMTLLPVGVVGSSSQPGNCPDGASSGTFTTGPVIPRAYNLEVVLSASQGDLVDPPVTFTNITVDPLSDTPIDDVEFVVDPTGNLSFRLAAIATGGNCAAEVDDGAGIVDFTLELRDGGTCVPVTFEIFDETETMVDTYAGTCPGTAYGACIPESYTLTVADVSSGPIGVAITGVRAGDIPCYVTTANIDVPGNDLTADIGAINIPVDATNKQCVPPKK